MSDKRAWSSAFARSIFGVLLLAVCGGGREVSAQDNLFRDTTNERTIHNQVQLALAPLERGYELLAASTSPAETDMAVQSLRTAYKYLRAAQEGSQRIANQAKYPDPMLKLRMDKIWAVRVRLLNCIDNQPHLDDSDGRTRTWCLEGLPEAIRRLRVLTVALP
jgi:hypothetical protein